MLKRPIAMNRPKGGPYFTIRAAADYLGGISKETIRRLIRTGKLERCGVGDRPLVRKSDLDRLVECGRDRDSDR